MTGAFVKHYPSAEAAERARLRSVAARAAGVATPAVLDHAETAIWFQAVAVQGQPGLAAMAQVLAPLHRMPVQGLARFDPFQRIRPRLPLAPHMAALARGLLARDRALAWPATAVVHGDFHPGQVLCDTAGQAWLVDLDDLALAPPEADWGNLAAWTATQGEGDLAAQVARALDQVGAAALGADAALMAHFCDIALLRRALKLAEKGRPWALSALWA